MIVHFTVNGSPVEADAPPETPLLWVLREHLKLPGTRFGCGAGLCGACMVHIDGDRAFSCQTQLSGVEDRAVTTIEGLSKDSTHPVQKAWLKERLTESQATFVARAIEPMQAVPSPFVGAIGGQVV